MVICGLILRMRNVSDKSCGENQNILLINLFAKITPFMINVEKYCTARQATDGSIIQRRKHVICTPVTNARLQTHTHNVLILAVMSSLK